MKIEKEIRQKKFKSEYQKLFVNILYTSNWLIALDSRRLKPYGLSPEQFNILRILRGRYPAPATVNLLTERMLNKMSNASRLVEKLRLKGLVDRQTCSQDRRAVDVAITEKGLKLLEELDQTEKELEKRLKNLSPGQAGKLNSLLDKLRG